MALLDSVKGLTSSSTLFFNIIYFYLHSIHDPRETKKKVYNIVNEYKEEEEEEDERVL
jgi:hypothetical protein